MLEPKEPGALPDDWVERQDVEDFLDICEKAGYQYDIDYIGAKPTVRIWKGSKEKKHGKFVMTDREFERLWRLTAELEHGKVTRVFAVKIDACRTRLIKWLIRALMKIEGIPR